MKYYSEILKKTFDTEKECVAAEKEYNTKLEAAEKKRKELTEKRKERAKEVEDAYKAARDAQKKYIELLNTFCKDYGSFHFTYNEKLPATSLITEFLDWF